MYKKKYEKAHTCRSLKLQAFHIYLLLCCAIHVEHTAVHQSPNNAFAVTCKKKKSPDRSITARYTVVCKQNDRVIPTLEVIKINCRQLTRGGYTVSGFF